MDEQQEKKQGHKGKGKKNKSLLVWDIHQNRTDENHAIQLKEIVEHLKMYGITAERHSIKCDINDRPMYLQAVVRLMLQTLAGSDTFKCPCL